MSEGAASGCRRKRIQQCADPFSGSRDRSLVNITYFDDADPGITGMNAFASSASQRQPIYRRNTSNFLISTMALAGFRFFGQVRVQFMIVWQR